MAEELLQRIGSLWLKQAETSEKVKAQQFGDMAARIWGFLGKSYRPIEIDAAGVGHETPDNQAPRTWTRINKTREFVSLMTPHVLDKVLSRTARTRMSELPAELKALAPNSGPTPEHRLRDWLMEFVLNYTPKEFDLFRETRTAVQEALVKGRGLVWIETVPGPYGEMPASLYGSVDDLLIDPDCEQLRDAGFIVRRRQRSIWAVSKDTGIPAEKLRGMYASHLAQSSSADRAREDEPKERDVCIYYEVWSRMGVGFGLRDGLSEDDRTSKLGQALDALGQHVFLQIMPGVPYPLNLPPESLDSIDEIKSRLEWPLAFYEDSLNPWPCVPLDFIPNPKDPWATSPLEAAYPIQVFLDRVYTFLFAAFGKQCRKLLVTSAQLGEAVQKAITDGEYMAVVKTEEQAKQIRDLIYLIETTPLSPDAWNILSAAERKFEQASHMDPLMYGGGGMDRQMRSAEEAAVRESHVTSIPDDYRGIVIEWQSRICAKEAQALRLYTGPGVVAPLFGEMAPDLANPESAALSPLSWYWASLVNTDDPAVAAAEMEYLCEASPGTQKNRQKLIADAQMMMQTVGPVAERMMTAGDPRMWNNLMDVMGDAYEIPMSKLKIEPPPMGMPGAPGMPTMPPQMQGGPVNA